MKIAIFGATGRIGGTIAREALERGHAVTAIVRDPSRLGFSHERLAIGTGEITDADSVASAVAGHDAVGVAIGGRRDGRHQVVIDAVHAVLAGLPRAGVRRLLWVGGAASLEVAPGVALIDTPNFPADYLGEATPMVEALRIFRASSAEVDWTFMSPPILIEPGERTGRYRLGADQLVVDDKGASRISMEDYAVAFVDELEHPAHLRQRFTVAD